MDRCGGVDESWIGVVVLKSHGSVWWCWKDMGRCGSV